MRITELVVTLPKAITKKIKPIVKIEEELPKRRLLLRYKKGVGLVVDVVA